MAINLATKFESKTSELLKARAKTTSIVNTDWSWDGVNAIKVYTLTDPTMVTYNPTGNYRYGSPDEVQDTVQTFTLSRDRSWTNTIDMSNYQDTMEVRKPAKFLAQATKNVLVPEVDTYRLATLATAGALTNGGNYGTITARNAIVTAGATSASNAYTNFLAINANITDNEAPEDGRVAVMTAAYYNLLKQGGFVLDSDRGQDKLSSGDLGMVDGVTVVVCPSGRMPSNTDLIITHPSNLVAPEKLKEYQVHKNPPGVSGYLIEYRIRYDAFFDLNKIFSLGIHKTA
jgi:hypothetical protein